MNVIRKGNEIFISLLLGAVYLVVIGVARVLNSFIAKAQENKHSYWTIPTKPKLNKYDVRSPF